MSSLTNVVPSGEMHMSCEKLKTARSSGPSSGWSAIHVCFGIVVPETATTVAAGFVHAHQLQFIPAALLEQHQAADDEDAALRVYGHRAHAVEMVFRRAHPRDLLAEEHAAIGAVWGLMRQTSV